MQKIEFLKLIAVLDSSYKTQPIAKETLEIWYRSLSDIDYILAQKAVEKILLISRFYPTIAEIRETCLSLIKGKKVTGFEAWGTFRKYINIYSGAEDYERLKQDHPDIYTLVHAVGGRELLSGNADFVRPEFERMYNEHRAELTKEKLLPAGFTQEVERLRGTIYRQIAAGDEV
jgi:hypothetical protein